MQLKWLTFTLAVIGAFFVSGISAGLAAGMLRVWEVPVSGFFAAFSVVLVAYLSAPNKRILSAIVTFSIGAAIAFAFLKNASFPESHPLAYQPTWIPLLSTISGGVLSMLISAFMHKRDWPRV